MNNTFVQLAAAASAVFLMLVGPGFAQTGARGPETAATRGDATRSVTPGPAIAIGDDMRYWSFGECDRRFPNTKSPERAQCMRTVASDEARDLRAFRMCDMSHADDPENAAQCKNAYKANRERAAQDGLLANVQAAPAAPSPEMLKKVRAIAAAVVERDRTQMENPGGMSTMQNLAAALDDLPRPINDEELGLVSVMRAVGPLVALLLGLLLVRMSRARARARAAEGPATQTRAPRTAIIGDTQGGRPTGMGVSST